MSRQRVSQRLVVYQTRLFSTSALEQMPWKGQSLTRPAASLALRFCHKNLPVLASKTKNAPASLLKDLSYMPSLFEPQNASPLATTTLP